MFERFTGHARRIVVLSQEEARALGHNWIGTEHLLLALLRDEEGAAAQALNQSGVRLDEVRSEIQRMIPPGEVPATGHIPFTPRSKKVLELSLRESMKLRHRTIEPEHILLGLLREGSGLAAQVLVKQGANLDDVREAVLSRVGAWGGGGFRILPPQIPAMTRGGVAAFDRARALAQGKPVGSQHVLLGLFGDDGSLAQRALAELGLTREAVEKQLAALDATGTDDELPEEAGARRTRLQVAGNTVTVRFEDEDLARSLGRSLRRWREGASEVVELSGKEPEASEPFARLWRTIEGVSRELLQKVGVPSTGSERRPPGWSTRASIASYSLKSEPDGPTGRLWVAEGVDEAQVRRWLADWFEAQLPTAGMAEQHQTGCTSVSVHVGRMAEAVPGSPEPDAWTVTNFSFGPGPAPADWPRLPLQELMAFAVTDLRAREDPAAT